MYVTYIEHFTICSVLNSLTILLFSTPKVDVYGDGGELIMNSILSGV
jgi:hypothetical protein